ncbi:MAG: membrane dipeptidase [Clostridium sp.]|nr:membrane dipeptidase [Clostridium sp.]
MKYIDLHCDTAWKLWGQGGKLKKNNYDIDIEKLQKGNSLAQVFAFYVDLKESNNPMFDFNAMYDNFMKEVKNNKNDIEIVTTIKELGETTKRGKIGAFLSIEEGQVLQGDIKNLIKVYEKGIRMITLTWNYNNSLGYSHIEKVNQNKGLTSLGIEMVKEMESLGIIPDASHLSDEGFYDLVRECKKPFIVTHSNSRYITNNSRNLTDDMIKKLANKGGVMGLNFCSFFLGENKVSSIDDMVKHIKHIKKVGGIDVIALGSDFDGIENKVEIKDASEMGKLALRLEKEGFTYDEIEKIYNKNVIRLFNEVLK